MEMKPGFLARSLAGNDKGAVYEIQEDLGTHVLLLGPADRPFKKNKKHVQLIKKTKESYTACEEGKQKLCQKQT